MGRELKRLHFKMDSYNEEEGIFSGYAAVFENIDSGGDVIEPGAFTKTLAEGWERVKILALHNDGCLPIGRPLELKEDANGLFISARISDTTLGRDVKVLLRDNVLNELSIGYDPIIYDYDDAGIRHLREVKLWEVSVVTWAMNQEAAITDYKSIKDTTEWVRSVREGLLADVRAGKADKAIKSLQDVSRSMKETARAIDMAVEGACRDPARKVKRNCAGRKGSQGGQIEIYL